MRPLEEGHDGDDAETVFRDMILLTLGALFVVTAVMVAHLNRKVPSAEAAGIAAPGNVIVELRWPDEIDADLDLWVEAPGDRPVGYSNKGGTYFNLLRDDLGRRNDPTEVNYEVAYSRGVPEGEYTVNLHLYRHGSAPGPVPATVLVSVKPTAADSARPLLTRRVELEREGEERTVVRFRLDGRGDLVPGSVHDLQRPLRSAAPQTGRAPA